MEFYADIIYPIMSFLSALFITVLGFLGLVLLILFALDISQTKGAFRKIYPVIGAILTGVVVSVLLDVTSLYGVALFTIASLFIAPSVLAALERDARHRIDEDEEVWANNYSNL